MKFIFHKRIIYKTNNLYSPKRYVRFQDVFRIKKLSATNFTFITHEHQSISSSCQGSSSIYVRISEAPKKEHRKLWKEYLG